MGRKSFAAAALLLILAAGSRASAQDLAIDAFYGLWQGTGVLADDETLARDLDVEIRPTDAGGEGFRIRWRSRDRIIGAGDEATGVLRANYMTFRKEWRSELWRVEGADDAWMDSQIWARLMGDTLTIKVLAIDEAGDVNLQIYDRTLTPDDGMVLDYRRLHDGTQVRRIEGRLSRAKN